MGGNEESLSILLMTRVSSVTLLLFIVLSSNYLCLFLNSCLGREKLKKKIPFILDRDSIVVIGVFNCLYLEFIEGIDYPERGHWIWSTLLINFTFFHYVNIFIACIGDNISYGRGRIRLVEFIILLPHKSEGIMGSKEFEGW